MEREGAYDEAKRRKRGRGVEAEDGEGEREHKYKKVPTIKFCRQS